MNIIGAFADLPVLAQIAAGFILVVFALSAIVLFAIRFRIPVALAAGAVTAYGQWNSAHPSLVVPVMVGCIVWFVLRVLDASEETATSDDGLLEQAGSPSAGGGYDYCADANRIEADYHRRQREGRF